MKKRFFTFLSVLALSTLVSCGLFGSDEAKETTDKKAGVEATKDGCCGGGDAAKTAEGACKGEKKDGCTEGGCANGDKTAKTDGCAGGGCAGGEKTAEKAEGGCAGGGCSSHS